MDCSSIETDACHKAVCNEESGKCTVIAADDGTPCEDGAFCTVAEYCTAGICGAGQPNDCGKELPPCTVATCDEQKKECGTKPAADFTACASDDPCQVNTKCQNGLCIGSPKDCFFAPVPNECHVAVCNPKNGQCEPQVGNEGKKCTDKNELCTVDKICEAGKCLGGKPKDCSQLTEGCMNGVCDPKTGNCKQDPVPPGGKCDEAADECNHGLCDDNGNCKPVAVPGQSCKSAEDYCNVGVCDQGGKCKPQPANESKPCEDGNPCTSGEKCTAGVCGGGQSLDQIVYFSDDFSDNAAGWTLGKEWAISPAKASSNEDYGGPDPDTDHSPTGDNGVAGVVLGGNAQEVVHDYYYLTSPVIDADVQGTIWLGFWRWLNSDYLPYMQNIVEIYDGQSWVKLWETGDSPGVQDDKWVFVTHDVTKYKNKKLQVRWGFRIGSSGVFAVSSWNVDDVVLANVICPPK